MKLYGYKLVLTSDRQRILQTWGGVRNRCPVIPNPLFLPNGVHVHCAELEVDYHGFTLLSIEQPDMTEEELVDLREKTKAKIDEGAEVYRASFITPGSTQSLVYQAKIEEATSWLSRANDNVSCPLLEAEAKAKDKNMDEVARSVIDRRRELMARAATVEFMRMRRKAAIDAASSEDDILRLDTIDWSAIE